jgi:DNA modification methylase
MAYLIQRIREELAKEGLEPRTSEARDWLKAKVKSLTPSRTALMKDREKLKDKSMIGRMYFYFYDPKMKEMLPYYDRFPLVIPIERYQDGFLGLNLHYISPRQRVILLDKLSQYLNNHKYDETTRIRLSYDHLINASTIYEGIPCIKKYLYKQVKSRFLEITADEWDIAALLPTEYFSGASKNKVFSDSRKKF